MAFKLENIKTKNKTSNSIDVDAILKKEITLFGTSFSNKKKESFYVALSVLLKAGLTLKDALELISEEQKKPSDKKLIKSLLDELVTGKNLSAATENKKEFSEYETYSLQIGENTGNLERVTDELGLFYKRKNEQKRTIISALSYPVIVLCTAFAAIVFMLKFVVPMFEGIFKQNHVGLPWLTQVIIKMSNTFERYFWIGMILILAMVFFIQFSKKKIWYKKAKASFWLRVPFVGEFIRKVKIAQFTQAINLLTGSKIPLLNALELTRQMIDYYPLQHALLKVESDILKGKTLYESIKDIPIFDKRMSSLIKVAEETNQNETIFKRLTDQYNEEVEYKSKMISATIEPFVVLILGIIVATVLIAMYLPMFKMSAVIG
ncbi:MAG: type II secretion system F family protein [Flavobacteriaceae bacterium]|nr:MAG: type II secretion system F family protein [Flavobacteriaceae bacterium]